MAEKIEREPIPPIPQIGRVLPIQKQAAEMTQQHMYDKYDVLVPIETCYQYLLWCQAVVFDRLNLISDGQLAPLLEEMTPDIANVCGTIFKAHVMGEFGPPSGPRYNSPAEFEIKIADEYKKAKARQVADQAATTRGHGTYL